MDFHFSPFAIRTSSIMKIKSEEELIMKNFNFEQLGNCVMTICGFVVVGAVAVMAGMSADDTTINNGAAAGYSDAVNAIVNSNMWSSDKQTAIAAMDKHANREIYKAVIAIINNDSMWSSDKVVAIKALFGK